MTSAAVGGLPPAAADEASLPQFPSLHKVRRVTGGCHRAGERPRDGVILHTGPSPRGHSSRGCVLSFLLHKGALVPFPQRAPRPLWDSREPACALLSTSVAPETVRGSQ